MLALSHFEPSETKISSGEIFTPHAPKSCMAMASRKKA
jgi:hypothetical protein